MPSKTIEDFAYQVRDYMRSAEVIEGKNKLKVTAISTSASGITITYNYDSNGNLLDITFGTGTVTGGNIDMQIGDITDLTNGNDYVVSGCPSGGSTSPSTYFIWLRNSNSQSISGAPADTGDGATFTKTSEYAKVGIRIQNGFVISTPLVFKPMICTQAEWTHSHTYEPYYVPVKDSIKGKSYTLINNKLFAELRGNIVSLESPPSQSMTCAEVLAVTIPAEICPAHDIIVTGYVISGSNRLLGVFNVYSNGTISCGKNYNNGYADCADSDIVKFYCTYAI